MALCVATANVANAQNIVIQTSDGSISSSFGEMVFSVNAVPLMATGDIVSMLGNSDIHKELELMDDQHQRLRDIKARYDKMISEIQQTQKAGETEIDKKARQKEIEETRAERLQMMEEVLLPHQRDRLHQVSLQMKMRHRGDLQMLTGEDLADLLGITEEQKQRLTKRAEKIKKEMEAEIAEAKKRARAKLMDELTSDQRKKLEQMIGEDYDKTSKEK